MHAAGRCGYVCGFILFMGEGRIRYNRLSTHLEREAAAVKVFDRIFAQADTLCPIAGSS